MSTQSMGRCRSGMTVRTRGQDTNHSIMKVFHPQQNTRNASPRLIRSR
jgi:hypothetical protein